MTHLIRDSPDTRPAHRSGSTPAVARPASSLSRGAGSPDPRLGGTFEAHQSAAATGALLERSDELAQIGSALADGREGHGRFLVVEGPAGIGKTALLAAARTAAADAGMRVLRSRGTELERDFAFGVVRQLFEPPLAEASGLERANLLQAFRLQRAHPHAPRTPDRGSRTQRGFRRRRSRCSGPSDMRRCARCSTPRSRRPGRQATAAGSPWASLTAPGWRSDGAICAPPRETRGRHLPRPSSLPRPCTACSTEVCSSRRSSIRASSTRPSRRSRRSTPKRRPGRSPLRFFASPAAGYGSNRGESPRGSRTSWRLAQT